MRRGLLVLAATVAAAATLPPPASPEDLTIVSTVTTPRGRTLVQTQYLTAEKIRISNGEVDTILDVGSGRVLLVHNRRKEYSESSLDDISAFLSQLDAAMAGSPIVEKVIGQASAVTVEKGTGGRTIAGYLTEQYTISLGDLVRIDVWAAPGLQVPAGYFEARKAFFAALGPMGLRFQRLFDEMKKIPGFPLATATDARMRMGKTRTTVEATEVRKGAIPASTFEVPADYKKVPSAFAARG